MLSIADKRSLVFCPKHSQLMCFLRGIGLETRIQRPDRVQDDVFTSLWS